MREMILANYGSVIGNVITSDAPVNWKDASSNPRPAELDVVFSWGFQYHLQTNVGSVPLTPNQPNISPSKFHSPQLLGGRAGRMA